VFATALTNVWASFVLADDYMTGLISDVCEWIIWTAICRSRS